MRNLKRDYLNLEEKNFYMITKAYIQMVQGERNLENIVQGDVWDEWKKRGMITPGMQRALKTANTNLKKFCAELEDNLSFTTTDKLNKQLAKFDYKLVDDYTLQKLFRDANDRIKYAVMDREKLEPILQDVAAVRCVGCKCNYEKCPLFKMLDDIETPYVGEEPNCPYAANLDKFTDEELKNIQRMKDIVNGRHSVTEEFNRKVEYDEKPQGNIRSSISKCSKKSKKPRAKRSNSKKNRK